jgi:hypothetical protein
MGTATNWRSLGSLVSDIPGPSVGESRPRSTFVVGTWLGGAAMTLATLAALAGLLVPGLYRDVAAWIEQAKGADLSTVLLALPTFLVGAWIASRDAGRGRLIQLGVVLYLAYTYAIDAFSVAINPLTTVYIAVLGLSVWGGASLALATRGDDLPASPDRAIDRGIVAAFLVAVTILFGGLWLSQLASVAATGTVPEDLVKQGLPTNPIYALDLAFFLPSCLVVAFGVIRRSALATAFALPLFLFTFLIGSEILGGFLVAAVDGHDVPAPVAVVILAVTLGALALAGRLGRRPTSTQTATQPVVRAG